MVDNCTDHEKLPLFFSITLTSISDDVSWEIVFIYLFLFFFLTKRYNEGGRHLKSNVQDGRRSFIVSSFALQNTPTLQFTIDEKKCWDIILKWDNLGKQNNLHPSPIPSIQSWGVSCFQQIAPTAAQRCMEGVGRERFIFPLLSWQDVREAL